MLAGDAFSEVLNSSESRGSQASAQLNVQGGSRCAQVPYLMVQVGFCSVQILESQTIIPASSVSGLTFGRMESILLASVECGLQYVHCEQRESY
mmetsp:Transcript_12230/g.50534  ORF Transcript_12230/g.50534 Transcript_12230/m.50534 type:complete len:94 (-) Transcript_12230:593-874(-)